MTLFEAILNGTRAGVIRLIVDAQRDNPQGHVPLMQARNQNNESPTMYAIQRKMTYVAQVLIGLDDNLDYAVQSTGKTALMYAAERNYIDVVECIRRNNANLDIRDNDGNTALHHSAIKGCHDVYETLIRFGANANIPNNNGQTAIQLGVVHNHNMADPQEILRINIDDLANQIIRGLNVDDVFVDNENQEQLPRFEIAGHQNDDLGLFD